LVSTGVATVESTASLAPAACAIFAAAAISVIVRDDMVARLEGLEHGRDRRHAGAEQKRARRAFERGEHGLGLPHRGIVRAPIGEAGTVLVVGIAHIGGRHVQRHDDGLGDGIYRAHRLHRESAR
jgi:hypothetical protein